MKLDVLWQVLKGVGSSAARKLKRDVKRTGEEFVEDLTDIGEDIGRDIVGELSASVDRMTFNVVANLDGVELERTRQLTKTGIVKGFELINRLINATKLIYTGYKPDLEFTRAEADALHNMIERLTKDE